VAEGGAGAGGGAGWGVDGAGEFGAGGLDASFEVLHLRAEVAEVHDRGGLGEAGGAGERFGEGLSVGRAGACAGDGGDGGAAGVGVWCWSRVGWLTGSGDVAVERGAGFGDARCCERFGGRCGFL